MKIKNETMYVYEKSASEWFLKITLIKTGILHIFL